MRLVMSKKKAEMIMPEKKEEKIQCIFCNISSNEIVIEENGYSGKKCPKCNLIYISPRPISSEIQNLYSNDQAQISAETHISAFFMKRIYAIHNLKIIKKFIKKGDLLEIGAGSGSFLIEARKEGFQVYGIELNSILTNVIRNKLKIPCSNSTLNHNYFKDKKFDIIYHCDVTSHFYYPIEEFKKMYNNLNDSGFLVFETGNLGDVEKKYYNVFTKFLYPDHLYFFSEKNLKELLRLSGFKILKIYRYSILLQLKIIKTQEVLMNLIKNRKSKITINKNTTLIENKNTVLISLINFFKDIYNYFNYIIRYKIGYILPKKGRPQTVIVVAMKKK